MYRLLVISLVLLTACVPAPRDAAPDPAAENTDAVAQIQVTRAELGTALQRFAVAVKRVEPVAEAECRARLPRGRCNFKFAVDDRINAAPNAYQTLSDSGRPVIAFTVKLLLILRNEHEMGFIMGHEAAHHIHGHLPVVRAGIMQGALLGGLEASLAGADEEARRKAEVVGALTAIQGFSQEFELQADALGAIIAHRAGYNPLTGMAYLRRIRDPRNDYLGTHPANAKRIAIIRQTMANLQAQ